MREAQTFSAIAGAEAVVSRIGQGLDHDRTHGGVVVDDQDALVHDIGISLVMRPGNEQTVPFGGTLSSLFGCLASWRGGKVNAR